MTIWEITRMACYVVAAPSMLWLALFAMRHRMYAQMCLYGALAALFTWYMAEITIASTGINTREYRVIGTPMVVAIAVSALWLAVGFAREAKHD